MIGPVSGTGRAMMSSLQQAIQKGMPPDQAVQYVKSMAMQGVAPLTDLYAMMNQFQRLKQPQAQAPQTPPTIKDQLNMLDQQQQMGGQPPQMQGGIAGMQAPAPQGNPMDRGLGAIDAGRMQYPQFAGGGIVAFQQGGPSDSQEDSESKFAYLSRLKQQAIAQGNFALAESIQKSIKAALEESKAVARQAMFGPIAEGLSTLGERAFKTTPAELGRVQNVPTAAPTQSAVPTGTAMTPFSSPQAAGAAFDREIGQGRQGVRQEFVPSQPPAGTAMATTGGGRGGDRYAELRKGVEGRTFEEVADSFSPEEEKRINKVLSGLTAEKKDAVRMALAQAGFRMAAAAARGGRERTSFLGAAAEGAVGGMQQYAASQKELRQTEKELGKEMADLRKYQDQVVRGERTAKRDFEERKQRDILDLETKSEQLRQFNVELGQRLQIAGMQYGGEDTAGAARIKTLDVNILNSQLENAQKDLENVRFAAPGGIKLGSPEHTKLIQAAQNRVNSLNKQLSGMLSGAGGASLSGGTGPYSNLPKDQFEALFRKEFGI